MRDKVYFCADRERGRQLTPEINPQLPLVKVANQDGVGLKFAARHNH